MRTAIIAATLLTLPATLAADCKVRVVLDGGRVIEADDVRSEGGITYLALGGGEIGFPDAHVLRTDPCPEPRAERKEEPRPASRPGLAPAPGPRRRALPPGGRAADPETDGGPVDTPADPAPPAEDPGPTSPLADPEEALNHLRNSMARWSPESDFAKEDVNLDRARYDQLVETLRYRIPRWDPDSDFLDEDAMQALVRDEGALDLLRRDVPRWRPESTFLDEDDLLDRPVE